MSREPRGILLTGSTGFLGGELLARLLERADRPVYVLIRARSDAEAGERLRRATETLLGAEPPAGRATAVACDLASPGLGMDPARRAWLAERVGRIIHCAASVSFTLGLEESRRANVDSTRGLLELGGLCAERGGLDSFVHVSTAYVAGTHPGLFGESDLDVGQGFRNSYERSKFEAEVVVRQWAARLPTQVVRPSIVVGESSTGWTASFNVLYAPLRAFMAGTYPAIPARRSAPVDVVPVDYVAGSILALAGRPGTTYHLTAGRRCSSVGELVDLASVYRRRPPPRLISPKLYRGAIHPILVRTGSEPRRRALRRSEALFPYFSLRTRYDDEEARRALDPLRIEVPPLWSYFDRLIDFARAADWGRRSPTRRQAAMTIEPREREPVEPRTRRAGLRRAVVVSGR